MASGYGQSWQIGSGGAPAARHWQHGIGGNSLEFEYYQANTRNGAFYNATTNVGTSLPLQFLASYWSNEVQHIAGVPDSANNGSTYPTLRFSALNTNGNGAFIFYNYFDRNVNADNRNFDGDKGLSSEAVQIRVGTSPGLAVYGTTWTTNMDVGVLGSSTNLWAWDNSTKTEIHSQKVKINNPLTVEAPTGGEMFVADSAIGPTVAIGRAIDTDFYMKNGGSHIYFRFGAQDSFIGDPVSVNKAARPTTYALEVAGRVQADSGFVSGSSLGITTNRHGLTFTGGILTGIITNFVSAETAVSTGGGSLLDVAHGLGGTPGIVRYVLVCKTADLGFAPGDEVSGSGVTVDSGGATGTAWMDVVGNSTNVVAVALSGTPTLIRRSDATRVTITTASWKFKIYARL